MTEMSEFATVTRQIACRHIGSGDNSPARNIPTIIKTAQTETNISELAVFASITRIVKCLCVECSPQLLISLSLQNTRTQTHAKHSAPSRGRIFAFRAEWNKHMDDGLFYRAYFI